MKLKIVVDDKIPFIEGRLEPVAEVVYAAPADIMPELVKDADALLVRTRTKCDENLLGTSNVKLVATATIGMDHFDREWLGKAGITAVNAAGCNAPGVAQYVWSSLLRNGFDSSRHTLGVVGFGHIGSIVADWGRKMGVKILVCDPPRKDMGMEDEEYLPMEKLLRECDAVTLHTPLTHDGKYPTFHLISEKELKMMKPGAILVNASRGPVVDNTTWRDYLKNSDARGIIDVWEGEPALDKELLQLAEIATPHIAGYSLEGKERATRMVLEAVEKKFGVTVDKSGLEGAYQAPEMVNPEKIVASYDPYVDTSLLRNASDELERLRDTYCLRREPQL
ncbi:MAG: 4-phosphoerythronate dehydrogenase [Bacteroides sp.]|nr:4-phosphoerythronate dehydrogenase [Bacteroides sp.]